MLLQVGWFLLWYISETNMSMYSNRITDYITVILQGAVCGKSVKPGKSSDDKSIPAGSGLWHSLT